MNRAKPIAFIGASALLAMTLSGCTTNEIALADGQSVKTILTAQINDAEATARHGTSAPRGTDSEVSNTTVTNVRERSREGASRPSLMELLLGGMGRN